MKAKLVTFVVKAMDEFCLNCGCEDCAVDDMV